MDGVGLATNQVKKLRLGKQRSIGKQYWSCRYMFFMLLPVLIYYGMFHYGPMYGVLIAFKDYRVLQGITGSPWVGLANFKDLFEGSNFLHVFRNTLIINFYKLLFGFPAPVMVRIVRAID